ncbi:hypothetical protein LCGC14_1312790 [marine sediment metagenome]|uniref:Uncharacterized protein n=1 Tax=marine sediment metagenome TaxID=412755 RepID=A0A0F9NP77_9ZZZZ
MQQQPGSSPVAEVLQKMMGFPSPEKVLGELQRLNNNIETIQPDIHRLAQSLEGISGADLRNLSAALGNINAGDLLRMLNEFTALGSQLYEKLWGKK